MGTINGIKFIGNDNSRRVAAENPNGVGATYEYLIANGDSTGNLPGMPVIQGGAGLGSESGATSCEGTTYSGVTHIVELDPLQMWDCTTGYKDGDLMTCIPLNRNKGLRCRNVVIVDPVAQVFNSNDPLTATLTGFDANVTQDGATGVYCKKLYAAADPSADGRYVIEIIGDGW